MCANTCWTRILQTLEKQILLRELQGQQIEAKYNETFSNPYITGSSSGSSSRVRGAEKHEIYAAAFGSHLFYDLFSQGQGGHGPPGSATG